MAETLLCQVPGCEDAATWLYVPFGAHSPLDYWRYCSTHKARYADMPGRFFSRREAEEAGVWADWRVPA